MLTLKVQQFHMSTSNSNSHRNSSAHKLRHNC